MKKLGLTGSIATGKTTALRYFAQLGHPTFSADEKVHELYGLSATPEIRKFFPPAIINDRVDRDVLAAYLAQNPEKFTELENIIHPLVHEQYKKFIEESAAQQQQMIIADIPLLFEGNYDYQLDAVAVTYCSTAEQKRRVFSRPGMNEKKLQMILSRQMKQKKKKQLADYLIDTGGTLEETRQQVVNIAKDFLSNP